MEEPGKVSGTHNLSYSEVWEDHLNSGLWGQHGQTGRSLCLKQGPCWYRVSALPFVPKFSSQNKWVTSQSVNYFSLNRGYSSQLKGTSYLVQNSTMKAKPTAPLLRDSLMLSRLALNSLNTPGKTMNSYSSDLWFPSAVDLCHHIQLESLLNGHHLLVLTRDTVAIPFPPLPSILVLWEPKLCCKF